MRILNEKDEEVQASDVNSDLGYLVSEQILKEHHDAVPEIQEKGHYYPETFYFVDGSQYDVNTDGDNDPCVKANDDGVSFSYVPPEGEEPREVKGCDVKYIIDVEHQEAKDAYDEMETIQRYKLYTEEQLKERQAAKEKAQKREEFMTTGPERLSTAETDIDTVTASVDDITTLMADMIGA
jgi:hypothetical protein